MLTDWVLPAFRGTLLKNCTNRGSTFTIKWLNLKTMWFYVCYICNYKVWSVMFIGSLFGGGMLWGVSPTDVRSWVTVLKGKIHPQILHCKIISLESLMFGDSKLKSCYFHVQNLSSTSCEVSGFLHGPQCRFFKRHHRTKNYQLSKVGNYTWGTKSHGYCILCFFVI